MAFVPALAFSCFSQATTALSADTLEPHRGSGDLARLSEQGLGFRDATSQAELESGCTYQVAKEHEGCKGAG